MISKTLFALLAASSLAGCTHINQYVGDDASLVPIPCGVEIHDSTGKAYKVYSSIVRVDGAFSAAEGGCPNIATYRIKPGIKHLSVIPNLDNPSAPVLLYATVEVTADLSPSERYELLTSIDGGLITVKVRESSSGRIVGSGQTSEIKQSAKGNAALKAIPFINNK